jgi:hypothetical protein
MMPLDWTVVASLAVTLAVALTGFLATYFNGLRLAQRKDRLDRVNRQLSELYGPLLALVSASHHSWEAFRRHYRTTTWSYWDPKDPPNQEEEQAWRQWMRHVFMPLNERMMELVVTKADLLETTTTTLQEPRDRVSEDPDERITPASDRADNRGDGIRDDRRDRRPRGTPGARDEIGPRPEIPKCLLDLAAHVAAYQAFIAQWDEGNFSDHKSLINFPPDVLNYATKTFARLKEEQQGLLGQQRRDAAISRSTSASQSIAADSPRDPGRSWRRARRTSL